MKVESQVRLCRTVLFISFHNERSFFDRKEPFGCLAKLQATTGQQQQNHSK